MTLSLYSAQNHSEFPRPADSPHYTWVITNADKGLFVGEIGTAGPRGATDEMVRFARKNGITFKMYDDDGNWYYTGKIVFFAEPDPNDPSVSLDTGFEPLDDFGRPNAGATDIRYKDLETGKYTSL